MSGLEVAIDYKFLIIGTEPNLESSEGFKGYEVGLSIEALLLRCNEMISETKAQVTHSLWLLTK